MAIDFRILLILMEVYPLYILILSATRERAEEIPEELRFTPATASRYMGILLSNHFVTVEKKDGKVYYRLNSETIAEVIRYMEGVFLNYMPPHDGLTS